MKRALGLIVSISLAFIMAGCTSNQHLALHIEKPTVTMGSDETATVDFSTAKNAKYKVLDKDNDNAQVGKTYTTKTGSATLTLNSPGHYQLEVTKDNIVNKKNFVVKPAKVKEKVQKLSFGKSTLLGNDSEVVEMSVDSVDQVSSDDSMVVDVSSNESNMKQFVIVTYTIKAVKGTIDLNDFDGSELDVYDSKDTAGSASSNRDDTPDTLHKGQSAKLRIGFGLHNSSDTATVAFGDNMWTGNINK